MNPPDFTDRTIVLKARGSPFLNAVCEAIRTLQYSIRTEEAYVGLTKHYILYHEKRHPREMREQEVAAFLFHLAVDLTVAPATQNQALNALLFVYRVVLDQPLGEIPGIVRAKRQRKLPTVFGQREDGRLLNQLTGVHWLIGCLLYGSGLRLMESVRLRVKDIGFEHRAVIIRDAKGRQRSHCHLAYRARSSTRPSPGKPPLAV